MTATTVPIDLDVRCIDIIRTLSMDAVQAANSGHPGTPMALAPVAYSVTPSSTGGLYGDAGTQAREWEGIRSTD